MPTAKQLTNLRPFATPEIAREKARKGGIVSGQKKRQLKEIRLWAEQNLFTERGQDKKPLYEMLFKKLEQLCSQGNLKAIEMFFNYSGLKPIDKVATVDTKGNDVETNKPLDIDKLKELKEILK